MEQHETKTGDRSPPLTAEEQNFLGSYRATQRRWPILCFVFGLEPVKVTLLFVLWWRGWPMGVLICLVAVCVLVLAYLGSADEENERRALEMAETRRRRTRSVVETAFCVLRPGMLSGNATGLAHLERRLGGFHATRCGAQAFVVLFNLAMVAALIIACAATVCLFQGKQPRRTVQTRTDSVALAVAPGRWCS
jgi:uncharacterized integral membrane protein